jgi:hypothetical protein
MDNHTEHSENIKTSTARSNPSCHLKIIGKTYGQLTVEGPADPPIKNQSTYWVCLCDCGNRRTVMGTKLTTGRVTSCKPCGKKRISAARFKHGLAHKTPLFQRWARIQTRCYNKNDPAYHNYGARGIEMCSEWRNNFMSFYTWAISNGWDSELSIERIDNNKGYFPENCKFATVKEQVRNRRVTKTAILNGQRKPLAEWCELLNLPYSTINVRLHKGWSDEEALTIPIGGKRRPT